MILNLFIAMSLLLITDIYSSDIRKNLSLVNHDLLRLTKKVEEAFDWDTFDAEQWAAQYAKDRQKEIEEEIRLIKVSHEFLKMVNDSEELMRKVPAFTKNFNLFILRWLDFTSSLIQKPSAENQSRRLLEELYEALDKNIPDFKHTNTLPTIPRDFDVMTPENKQGLRLAFFEKVYQNKEAFEKPKVELSYYQQELFKEFEKNKLPIDRDPETQALLAFMKNSQDSQLKAMYTTVDELWKKVGGMAIPVRSTRPPPPVPASYGPSPFPGPPGLPPRAPTAAV